MYVRHWYCVAVIHGILHVCGIWGHDVIVRRSSVERKNGTFLDMSSYANRIRLGPHYKSSKSVTGISVPDDKQHELKRATCCILLAAGKRYVSGHEFLC